MSVSLASAPWPAPSAGVPSWRFGREVSRPGALASTRWELARNCSITPAALGGVYLSLCAVAAAIAAWLWWNGATVVPVFSAIELLAFGIALVVQARHAGDRELLTLDERSLEVEQRLGPQVERTRFETGWISIEMAAAEGSLIELKGGGRVVRVGRFVRPELRAAFAQELRGAVRRARERVDA
mgnify:CR=1 FL=1